MSITCRAARHAAGFMALPFPMPSPAPRCGPCPGCSRARACPSPSSSSTPPACAPAAKCWVRAAVGLRCVRQPAGPCAACSLGGASLPLLPATGPSGRICSPRHVVAAVHHHCARTPHPAALRMWAGPLSSWHACTASRCPGARHSVQARMHCRRSCRASWTGRSSQHPSSLRRLWSCRSTGRCCWRTRVRRAAVPAPSGARRPHLAGALGPARSGRAGSGLSYCPLPALHQRPVGHQ